jgi:hypothetical protein
VIEKKEVDEGVINDVRDRGSMSIKTFRSECRTCVFITIPPNKIHPSLSIISLLIFENGR